MQTQYKARWISRARVQEVKRVGHLGKSLLFAHCNGFLIVEPLNSNLGDGPTLSQEDAEYELQDAWVQESIATLRRARTLLGLERGRLVGAGV
jgi:hypothetical protein